MRGLELPINVLIIVVLAVIVLIAILFVFYPAVSSGSQTVNSDIAKSIACQKLLDSGCGAATAYTTDKILLDNFDADRDGIIDAGDKFSWALSDCPGNGGDGRGGTSDDITQDNLATLCKCYYAITSENVCRGMCGC